VQVHVGLVLYFCLGAGDGIRDSSVTGVQTCALPICVAEIDHLGGGLLRRLAKSGELTGKMLEFTLLHAPAGLKAARLLLVGAGKIGRACVGKEGVAGGVE